jgi:predicted exporter/SAM-dependent methyltransferase
LFAATLGAIAVLLGLSFALTDIDTDITRYLPRSHKVLDDAAYIFEHHPIQSEMVVDLGLETSDPDRLVQAGDLVERRMRQSGLFTRVGTASMQQIVPALIHHIVENLPLMFTAQELETRVLPLLDPHRIKQRLTALQTQLYNLDAIGQAALISHDPLELRTIAMARLAHLAPAAKVELYKGKLLSSDQRHLLIIATPAASAADTGLARKIDELMRTIAMELEADRGSGSAVRMTPMGAYRAALDNEFIARRDVRKAILLATAGIALLLIFAFPRPLIGLFAFLPAVAGTVSAFFVLAVTHDKISIMALGFGGAIISITVDHGIAYLLFLDRSRQSYGHQASTEIWAIGLMAALTTVGAFGSLCLSGFPIFVQLGQFTALGIAFSFLFVHSVFPRIFPQLPPARRRSLPLRRLVEKMPTAGKKSALAVALFFCGMLFFANPQFNVSLNTMNTVSSDTQAAERLMTSVWGGGLFSRIYLLTEGKTIPELQNSGDRLLTDIEHDMQAGHLASGFVSSMLFPGSRRSRQNVDAWQAFWTPSLQARTREAFAQSLALGFSADAFAPFFKAFSSPHRGESTPIPDIFFPLVGIIQHPDGTFMQFSTLTPGSAYHAQDLNQRYASVARMFDPGYFSQQLGALLFATFVKMLVIIGFSVTVLIFLFFLDIRLTLICLAPVVFALVCTLGSLKLIGHALDIPALMLAIIVMGMGIDYALFLVRAYQRYGSAGHPAFGRIRLAVVMASTSTLIGFGVLCLAEHALLRSAGMTSLLGIGYSLTGAFVLLPPLLKHHFAAISNRTDRSGPLGQRVMERYRPLEAWPRIAARLQLKTDPLFDELPDLLGQPERLGIVLDIGCGYGVTGNWLMDRYPGLCVYGSDANPEKIRAAAISFGQRGRAFHLTAPDIAEPPQPADAALLVNVIHKLNDAVLLQTLKRLRHTIQPTGRLIIRVPLPADETTGREKWKVLLERLYGGPTFLRSERTMGQILGEAGFRIDETRPSGERKPLQWFVATPL